MLLLAKATGKFKEPPFLFTSQNSFVESDISRIKKCLNFEHITPRTLPYLRPRIAAQVVTEEFQMRELVGENSDHYYINAALSLSLSLVLSLSLQYWITLF